MPIYDIVCPNLHETLDVWKKTSEPFPQCAVCGQQTQTLWKKSSNVIQDTIEGGILIEHGLCHEVTGEPIRYYSKSAMTKEAKRRGLINKVRHVGDKGSDRNKNTQRWI